MRLLELTRSVGDAVGDTGYAGDPRRACAEGRLQLAPDHVETPPTTWTRG